METQEENIQTLAKTLENVTQMLTQVVLKQTELSNRQLDIFEKGSDFIKQMYDDSLKNKED
jgi:hypothetical protein|nr:MAG TPA: hypothetical protein [Caudoviricetes sp.]